MIVLYEHPLSPYAQKVKIALVEKGVAFEARLSDFFGSDAAFAGASPRLEVPALIDGDVTVLDSTIILAMAGFTMVPQLIESGAFKREYRGHRLEWMLRCGAADVVLEGMHTGTIRFSREID